MNGIPSEKSPAQARGFLLITLVIILVIVGFMGAAIAYVLSAGGRSVGRGVQSNQALSLAEAGLSKGTFLFKSASSVYPCPTTVSASNPSCSVSSWSNPETLGISQDIGQFQYRILLYTGPAWSSRYIPAPPITTTTASVSPTANSQIIPVVSVSNFAPTAGQIMIDANPVRYINYFGTSTDAQTCGGAPACFTDVLYLGSGTIPSGKTVTQNQTLLSAAVRPSSALQAIRLNDVTNLAPSGQVVVANKTIAYTGLSSDPAICGGIEPCLVGAFYPSGSVLPINSRVSQNQIVIQGQGSVPNFLNPQGQRTVSSPLLMSIQCVGTNPGKGAGNNGNGCGTNGNGGGTGSKQEDGCTNNPGNGSNNNGNGKVSFVTVYSLGTWMEVVN